MRGDASASGRVSAVACPRINRNDTQIQDVRHRQRVLGDRDLETPTGYGEDGDPSLAHWISENAGWPGEGREGWEAAPAAPSLVRRSRACVASGLFGKRLIRLRNSCTAASRCPASSSAYPFLSCAAAALLPPGYWSSTRL